MDTGFSTEQIALRLPWLFKWFDEIRRVVLHHSRLDDQWRYFLVTSLAGRIGTREIYLRLNDAFAKKLSEHEAQGFAFFIADPNDGLVKDVGRSVSTEGYASQPTSISVTVGGKRARVHLSLIVAAKGG